MPRLLTREEFIAASQEVHGNRFDYSHTDYKNSNTDVEVICPSHGPFMVKPSVHKRGFDCPKCSHEKASKRNRHSLDEFLLRARNTHANKYDYSRVQYKNQVTPVTIVCPEHGPFQQRPQHHISGCGCTRCGYNKFTGKNNPKYKTAHAGFVAAAHEAHKGAYDYSKFVYKGSGVKGTIVCKEHGNFSQTPGNHVSQKQGCPKCFNNVSSGEQEMFEFVRDALPAGTLILQSNRKEIYPYELDIFVPALKVAIEFNGTYWHSELYKRKDSHVKKQKKCLQNGIQLIQVTEHAWTNHKQKVKGMLRAKLGVCSERVFARKCEVREVSKAAADKLLNDVHMQGTTRASLRLGLYQADRLLGVMTFGRPRFTKGRDWELIRLCFAHDVVVVGGSGKLWKHFERNHLGPDESVVTYANLMWSLGCVYERLGFELERASEPGYVWYCKKNLRPPLQRYKTQKHKLGELLGDVFDKKKTEIENMHNAGYVRVYDCGNLVFGYRKPKKSFKLDNTTTTCKIINNEEPLPSYILHR